LGTFPSTIMKPESFFLVFLLWLTFILPGQRE
jgi:hypothetical protein